jgi:1,4-dihydroxy-2-naphthoate octaprenyltransferase
MAARPRTLPAAAAPVIVGSAVAWHDGVFQWLPALAALLGALLIQIGTNLANDVFDHEKGADTADRLGPTRVTNAGLLSPREVYGGMALTFAVALVIGLYLVAIGGWPIVIIGLASIVAGVAYTGGPFPLGYNGLGDVFVFIFFGLVAVSGTYYVQAGTLSPLVWWVAVPIGLLAVNIIVVNNLRDIDTDRKAGKRTLAVRLGASGARWEYALILVAAFACPLLAWLLGGQPAWLLVSWLSLPLALRWLRAVQTQTGRPLNAALAGSGQVELLFALLLTIGLVLDHTVR